MAGSLVLCLCVIVICGISVGDPLQFRLSYETTTPLPFPTCRADNIDCLRRGIRTFFFLMDSRHLGMKPVDPTVINSVALSLPNDETSFLLRRINVTGVRWTRLMERQFNLVGDKSGIRFQSDLHAVAEIRMTIAKRLDPFIGFITIDMQDVESNVTYAMSGVRGNDGEDYILIGPERITVRNQRTPSFFIQPNTQDTNFLEKALLYKPTVLEHLTNEITAAVMHNVMDNFRLFATKVPVKYYYKYV